MRRPLDSGDEDERAERTERRVDALLSDLGSQLRRGSGIGPVEDGPDRLPVGRDTIDRRLGGGIPLGALSEISGPSSSGRTSLCLALLASTTARGELVGWVDCADAFDPASARGLGVDLDRVLWVRARGAREALRASERLLQTEGFPLVMLDWRADWTPPKTVSWIRLSRLAASSRTALLLSSDERESATRDAMVSSACAV